MSGFVALEEARGSPVLPPTALDSSRFVRCRRRRSRHRTRHSGGAGRRPGLRRHHRAPAPPRPPARGRARGSLLDLSRDVRRRSGRTTRAPVRPRRRLHRTALRHDLRSGRLLRGGPPDRPTPDQTGAADDVPTAEHHRPAHDHHPPRRATAGRHRAGTDAAGGRVLVASHDRARQHTAIDPEPDTEPDHYPDPDPDPDGHRRTRHRRAVGYQDRAVRKHARRGCIRKQLGVKRGGESRAPGRRHSPRRVAPRPAWLLLALVLGTFWCLLLADGLVRPYVGIDVRGAVRHGSTAQVPDSVLDGGSVLHWTNGEFRSLAVPDRTIALTFDDGPDPEWTPRSSTSCSATACPRRSSCSARTRPNTPN